MRAASRIINTAPKTYGMYELAAAASAAKGDRVIRLELGRPCADTPLHVKQATIDAIVAGDVHYSDMRGVEKLRKAIAARLNRKNRIAVTEDEILVTNGLTHGSFAAFMAFLDPNDEVILLDPHYPQHVGKIELAGAKVVFAPLDAGNNFAINGDAIRRRVTPRTRMIVLVNPANPTGRVHSRAELQAVADIAIDHDLIVVSDEVYEDVVYDNGVHVSIASLPGMKERTISLFAFTKSFAMDGWRLGYLAADAAMIGPLMKITMNDATHVNTFIQAGAHAALTGPPSVLAEMVDDDNRKRNIVVSRLNQMPGIRCAAPEGTIYAFPDIRALNIPSRALAERILEQADVSLEAGSFYGPTGEGFLRICFGAETDARLIEAMDRLQAFFNSI